MRHEGREMRGVKSVLLPSFIDSLYRKNNMIRVVAALIERDGKVLVGKRRSDEEHFPGKGS